MNDEEPKRHLQKNLIGLFLIYLLKLGSNIDLYPNYQHFSEIRSNFDYIYDRLQCNLPDSYHTGKPIMPQLTSGCILFIYLGRIKKLINLVEI